MMFPLSKFEANQREWETRRVQERRIQEVQDTDTLRRGLARSPARKRMGEENKTIQNSSNKKKKYKYPFLDENWGE